MRPRQRTRTGPASVISFGRVNRIATGYPSFTSCAKKKYTPRELTSRDSVLVSPTAAPVVQRTVSGRRMEKRWVGRGSERVKRGPPDRKRVYPGITMGTIGLWVQKNLSLCGYQCTRTGSIRTVKNV